jgi:pimeloyl-ACP methyl ester carboxylesterase
LTFADRVGAGERQLGLAVRLPADEVVTAAFDSGLAFVAVDLVAGLYDEAALSRIALLTHAHDLGVVAVVEDAGSEGRLSALGVDLVVRREEILLTSDVDGARRVDAAGPALVALDLSGLLARLVGSFAAASREADGLVLLPGMLGDASLFEDVVGALPDIPCRPMRIDLDNSIDELAASVLAAAPERFALVGHSLGGIVAMEIWRRAPHRVTRLALLNTSARPPTEAQLAVWDAMRERVTSGGFEDLMTDLAADNLGAANGTELATRWIDMARTVGVNGFLRQLDAQARRPDSRPSLPTITVPTVVVSGELDGVCPPELQQELAVGIPGARHVTVPGAGHMTPLDHPSEVAAHLTAWLSS